MTPTLRLASAALLVLGVVACGRQEGDSGASPEFVVVYTSMDESELAPLYEGFRAATGTRIQQVSRDYERLLEMMHDKQRQPAADVFLAVGSAVLGHAASENIFRPTYSSLIEQEVPANFRDPDSLFTAFAIRPNAIVYDSSRSDIAAPARYESLAEPEWQGKLCLTSSAKSGNIAWVSLLLARYSKREAEMIVRGMIRNLAVPVFDEVPELIAAIESGVCAAAIADFRLASLYLSGHAGDRIALILPSAENGGTQIDIAGAGVTRHAGNAEGAARFLEWLASDDGQRTVAGSGIAFPVSPDPAMPAPDGTYGPFSPADINVSQLAMFSPEAIALVERAHYP